MNGCSREWGTGTHLWKFGADEFSVIDCCVHFELIDSSIKRMRCGDCFREQVSD